LKRFISPTELSRWRRRLAAALQWEDRALSFAARWGVPGGLGFLIVSGVLLPQLPANSVLFPGLRSLHVLAGLALLLAAIYQGVLGANEFALRIWERVRGRPMAGIEGMPRETAGVRGGLRLLHRILLGMMLWTGLERYTGQRWGSALLPILTVPEWGLAHRILASYYLASLLLHWFVKSRIAWRALLDELRRP
jgi:hypothetical protein